MMPILYGEQETAFADNGLGILSDAIRCEVTETFGMMEMLLEYPMGGLHFPEIRQRAVVCVEPAPGREPQPFRVYRITKPIRGAVQIYARHIAYDLMGDVVTPFQAGSVALALQGLRDHAATETPFEFWTDKTTVAQFRVDRPRAIWELLGGTEGSILDVYGGEYEFDGFAVKLHNRRGADRGVTIRYGKNLTDLTQDANCANCYTGVYPYWADYDGKLVQLPEQIVNAPGQFSYSRILPLDLSAEFEKEPSVEQLRTRAEAYIRNNKVGVPVVSLTVGFVPLEQTVEYQHAAPVERVSIGDTVSVEFEKMGVSASARVVRTKYDAIRGRYIEVEIGAAKSRFEDIVVGQQHQIDRAPTTTDLEQARIAATAWLTNGKGYKVERRDDNGNTIDTLYMDKPDINQAVNVLRIGQSGIGFSHNGVNGPYASAWTIDGRFSADFITTGSLSASLIKTGSLQADLIKLLGRFAVYNGATLGGSIGYQSGATPDGGTNGIGLKNPAGDCYCVVTDGGVAVKAGEVSAFIAKDGSAWLSAPKIVFNGNMVVNGEVTAWKLTQTGKEA